MKVNRLFCFLSLLVIVTAFAEIVFHLHFWVLPSVFFAVGLAVTLWNRKFSLLLFLFLFPFINASPELFDTGLPFNYLAVSLFLLSGIVVAGVIRKISHTEERDAAEDYLDKDFYSYYFFLIFVLISAIFVFFRWSNITFGTIDAVGADTPVSPGGQRISFASIFPIVSLFIYFISPYIFFYVKKVNLKEKTVFTWLSYGFFVSVGIALIQSISGRSLISDRLGKELSQFYGGFSDFNAFGFFSGVMFLWSTYEIRKKNIVGYITFAASLGGGILSGSRTMYFFILAGIINIIFSFRANPGSDARKKQQRIVIVLLIIGVVLVVVFAGGTLKERLSEGFSGEKGFWEKLNAVTNGRVWMTAFSLETVKDNFVPGVGTGNFTFYLAYKNHGQEHLYDLTLNHYLLVFTENGVFAFLFFTFFMVFLFRRSTKKLLLGAILFSLLLNNFFWFPEAFLLFWIVAALNDSGKYKKEKKELLSNRNKKLAAAAVVLIFLIFNIFSFNGLHPKTWAKETGTRYDYGFWYSETDASGHEYRWTKERAGIHLALGKTGLSPEITLVCGAPLAHLKDKKQTVEIYWKGKPYKEITFTENKTISFRIESQPLDEGFLELRVSPAFNLKEMGFGQEPRGLGIQLKNFIL